MRTRTILAAAAVGVAAMLPASAQAATLQVVQGTRVVAGTEAEQAASATSYVDSKGHRHALKAHTALGQVVALGRYTAVYSAGMGAFLTRIAGRKAPTSGYWGLFVNGRPSMVGAADVVLKASDAVVWIADTDYSSKNGPYAYWLRSTDAGDGSTTFTGMRVGGPKATPAYTRNVVVTDALGEHWVRLDAQGRATFRTTGSWTAVIPAHGRAAPSQVLAVSVPL